MILACGIPSEDPLSMVVSALRERKAHVVVLNQREFADVSLDVSVTDRAIGWLLIGNASYRVEEFEGVYIRLMDDRFLPELAHEPTDSALRAHCRALHDSLAQWFEVSDARVLNRPSSMASNNSKPFQAQLIRRCGFEVPETLITNDPDLVREFRARHGSVIYKSLSGVRSIVALLSDDDDDRLERLHWCPTQFQEFIAGENVRVHVVGRRVFATRVRSDAVDYRYATRQVGTSAELEECELASEWAERCVLVAERLGLPFAGIDLKMAPDGRVYCFEVNPSPGFSYYEFNTGQPIARAVGEYLLGGERGFG
jgi:glutathione synthase/RimK-type ligase-like ATP-grasp enzyme